MRLVFDGEWTFRFLPDALRELGIEPRGVIHVGAHHGEEVPVYQACGFESITLVEPDPECWAVLRGQAWFHAIRLVGAACKSAGRWNVAPFHRTRDALFSGLVRNPAQETVVTFSVPAVPVSMVQASHPANVLVVDTQGTELDVLRSADLASLDLVIVETQPESPEAHGAFWPDLMAWAAEHRWTPAIQWVRDHGWADTLLVPEAGRG